MNILACRRNRWANFFISCCYLNFCPLKLIQRSCYSHHTQTAGLDRRINLLPASHFIYLALSLVFDSYAINSFQWRTAWPSYHMDLSRAKLVCFEPSFSLLQQNWTVMKKWKRLIEKKIKVEVGSQNLHMPRWPRPIS